MLHAHIQEFGVQQDGWLFVGERNGGVPPTTVAEWAGHSVEVLLRIYAKCLDGGDALIRQRVQAALGHGVTDIATDAGTNRAQIPAHSRPQPDLVGHATRPLTLIPTGQRPCCTGPRL